MTATHVYTENKTKAQIAGMVLRALERIEDCPQGTIRNPINGASSVLPDGRTLIKTVAQDGFLRYNDGWYIVEVDDFCLYVDVTSMALREMGNPQYKIIDKVNQG